MLIELQELSSDGSHVDNVEHVCLPWGNVELCVLTLVDQGRIWNWLCTIIVVGGQVVVDQVRCLNVVHISERQRILSIDLAIVFQYCVVANDERAAESICESLLDSNKWRQRVAYQCTGHRHVRGTSMYLIA